MPDDGRRVYMFLGMDLLFPLMLFCLAMENSPLLCAVLGVAFFGFSYSCIFDEGELTHGLRVHHPHPI